MLRGDQVRINGSGEISRDFCHVRNVVQANLLAATVQRAGALNEAYNIAVGRRTTLDELFVLLRDRLAARHPRLAGSRPAYGPPRSGDVMHSLADIDKARRLLGYEPTCSTEKGLDESLEWYERNSSRQVHAGAPLPPVGPRHDRPARGPRRVTTFATMAYIIVVNPAILSFAGIPVGPGRWRPSWPRSSATLLMGLYANRPIAVAPYMGENAFVAFGLAAIGATWPQMLGAVFVSGLVFLAITLLGVRAWLAEAISPSLKHAFAVGSASSWRSSACMRPVSSQRRRRDAPLALTGPGGLLRAPDVPLKVGDLRDPRVLLAVFGFLLIAVLLQRKVQAPCSSGIAATAVVGPSSGSARRRGRSLPCPSPAT